MKASVWSTVKAVIYTVLTLAIAIPLVMGMVWFAYIAMALLAAVVLFFFFRAATCEWDTDDYPED